MKRYRFNIGAFYGQVDDWVDFHPSQDLKETVTLLIWAFGVHGKEVSKIDLMDFLEEVQYEKNQPNYSRF